MGGMSVGTPPGSPDLRKYQVASPGLYETCPRWALTAASVNLGGTSGTVSPSLYAVSLPAGLAVSKIGFLGGLTTPTHWFFQLYDSTFHLLAESADQGSAAWAAGAVKALDIAQVAAGAASSFKTTYEGLHYICPMIQSTSSNFPETTGGGFLAAAPALAPWLTTAISRTAITAFPYSDTQGGVNAGMVYGFVG